MLYIFLILQCYTYVINSWGHAFYNIFLSVFSKVPLLGMQRQSHRVKSADLTLLSYNSNSGHYDLDEKGLMDVYNVKAARQHRSSSAVASAGGPVGPTISKSSIRSFVKYVNHLSDVRRKESSGTEMGSDPLATMDNGGKFAQI